MDNLTGQYIVTIAVPFVIAIVALALPLMLDASSKISEQYKSSFMAKAFQKEWAHKVFVITLVVSVLAIVLYMLKLPVIDAFSDCWLIANSAVLLVYGSTLVLVIALLVLARIISIYYRQDRLLKYLTNKYNLKSKWCKKHDKDVFLSISKLMNYSIDNADEELARGIFSFFVEAFVKFRIGKKEQVIDYPDEFYDTVFEASELLCRRQRQTVSYYNDGTLYDFFIDSYQQTLVSQKTLRFMWMCVIQNAKYDKDEHIFSLWKKLYQHVSLFLDNKLNLLEEKRKFVEFSSVLCAYVLDLRKYDLLLKTFVIVHWPECMRLMMIAIMRSIDAVAWVRKYLVEASMVRGLYFFIRMGIMASRFISNPIQIISQCELIITIIVPRRTVIRIVVKIRGFISTGRV